MHRAPSERLVVSYFAAELNHWQVYLLLKGETFFVIAVVGAIVNGWGWDLHLDLLEGSWNPQDAFRIQLLWHVGYTKFVFFHLH